MSITNNDLIAFDSISKEFERVYAKTLNLLSGYAKSQNEIDTKLDLYLSKESLTKEQTDLIKTKIIELLVEQGLYDDNKFVKSFIDSMILSSKPRSKKNIANKLYSKGVDKNIIDHYLSAISGDDETQAIEKIIEKRLRKYHLPLSYKDKMDLIKYLLSKGYDYELSKSTVDSLNGVK
jgi:regulatory protein